MLSKNKYYEAKKDLEDITVFTDELNIEYDDTLLQVIYSSSSKELKRFHFDKNKLGIRIFLFLFFFGMLLIAGSKNLTTPFILYAAAIGLIITLISTITKTNISTIDFEKQIIRLNNKTIKFSKCKDFTTETLTVNYIPILYLVIIHTELGKINLSLLDSRDKQVAYKISQWANKYIVD